MIFGRILLFVSLGSSLADEFEFLGYWTTVSIPNINDVLLNTLKSYEYSEESEVRKSVADNESKLTKLDAIYGIINCPFFLSRNVQGLGINIAQYHPCSSSDKYANGSIPSKPTLKYAFYHLDGTEDINIHALESHICNSNTEDVTKLYIGSIIHDEWSQRYIFIEGSTKNCISPIGVAYYRYVAYIDDPQYMEGNIIEDALHYSRNDEPSSGTLKKYGYGSFERWIKEMDDKEKLAFCGIVFSEVEPEESIITLSVYYIEYYVPEDPTLLSFKYDHPLLHQLKDKRFFMMQCKLINVTNHKLSDTVWASRVRHTERHYAYIYREVSRQYFIASKQEGLK